MKTKSKFYYYSTLLVSVMVAPLLVYNVVRACGGDGFSWRDIPQVFMQPDLEAGQKRFEPFYYTIDFYNWPENANLAPETEPFLTDENTAIWFKQLNEKIDKKDIYDFLYQSPKYVCDSIPVKEDFLNLFGQQSFVKQLVQNKEEKALHYFMLAKANEFGTEELDNGWNYFNNYDAYGTDNLNEASVADHLYPYYLKELQMENDSFYKQRLAFQLIRYARYHYVPHVADSLYTLYFESSPESQLKQAAQNYATDALVNEGEQKKANYYAAMLFDKSEEKQERAFNNFSKTMPIEVVLPYCKNEKEQAMVYALYAFKDYYLNAAYIQMAVSLDPQNASINDLLVREINKIDHQLMPKDLYGYYTFDYQTEDTDHNLYNEEGVLIRRYPTATENTPLLLALIQTLQQKNPVHTHFYQLCLAHLQIISGDYATARSTLNSITVKSLPNKMRMQHHLTSAILHIKSSDLRKHENLNTLALDLGFIENNRNQFYYHEFLPNGLKIMAAGKLLEQGDKARAYLLAERVDNIYDSYVMFEKQIAPQDIDTIIAIRENPKGLFEKFIVSVRTHSNEELRDIQGSLYLREKNLVMANRCYALADKTFIPINFSTLNTNPDGHPCYPYNYEKITAEEAPNYSPEEVKRHNERAERLALDYNHYSITKTMLNLHESIKSKKGNLAQNYYNLACLYMEISYYGRAYTALEYSKSWGWYGSNYSDDKDQPEKNFNRHYYGSAWAIPYLELALRNSKNNELSAKCLYALFRCNRHLQEYMENKQSEKDIEYLYALHDKFANTDYYKIKECWGLTAYVNDLRSGKNNTIQE